MQSRYEYMYIEGEMRDRTNYKNELEPGLVTQLNELAPQGWIPLNIQHVGEESGWYEILLQRTVERYPTTGE